MGIIRQSIIKIDNPHNVFQIESKYKRFNYLVEEFSNTRAMLHIFVSDDEDTYTDTAVCQNENKRPILIDRYVKEVVKKLKNNYSLLYINISIITFGKGVYLGSNVNLPCIMLSPHQLHVISKNERITNNILYYFTHDKFRNNNIKDRLFDSMYGDFNYFIVYDENECSYYMDDSMSMRSMLLYIGFDVVYDYVLSAFSIHDNNVVKNEGIYYRLTNVENNVYLGDIDGERSFIIKGTNENFISIKLIPDVYGIAFAFAQCLSYWFSETIEALTFSDGNVFISISYNENLPKMNINKKDYYSIDFCNNDIEKLSNSNVDNTGEKDLYLNVLKGVNLEISQAAVLKAFRDKLKKKMYSFRTEMLEFMMPSTYLDYPIPIASKSKMTNLLDQIGEHFVDGGFYKKGDSISKAERGKLCNMIVEYVYNEFVNLISKYNFKDVIELSYSLLEKTIPETILRNDNYKNQIHLYPDKRQHLESVFSELNASSVALRFILEYAGAIQNEGESEFDFIALEELMAYAKTIFDWSTASDIFTYDMIDDDISVLESKRFGYNKDNIQQINLYLTNTQFDYLSRSRKKMFFKVSMKEKNDIFLKDFGYTFEEYISVLGLLFTYGQSIDGEVKSITHDEWIRLCQESGVSEKLYSIIDDISIEKRENYFKYKHYMKREFYPWRFNRLFSLFRRPLIKVDNIYLWGNRNLNHNVFYITNLIDQGVFDSGKKGKNYSIKYSGIIAERRGALFNDDVGLVISSFPNVKVFKNVISINSKHISDDQGNDLGDIDVLAIAHNLKRVFIIEVKDYSLSRNINDLSIEIKKLFNGSDKSKSAYEKHMLRYNWTNKHKSDVMKEFDLKGDWSIVPLFVTNQPMVSNRYRNDEKINMIDYDNLTYEILKQAKC